MKRNILVIMMAALTSFLVPANAYANEEGTHGADFSSENWDGDIDLGFNFENDESQTGVKEVSASAAKFRIGIENGEIVIWSVEHQLIPIHRVNGTVAEVVRIQPGKNMVKSPGTGIFIITGKQIAL